MRLDAFLSERRALPFAWGDNDCACFAAAAVEAMTGENPMPRLRYRTEMGAARAIKRGGGLAALVGEALSGCGEIPPRMAQRGDVVLFEHEGEAVVGICVGRHIASPGPQGLALTPLRAGMRAWRI